MALSAHVYTYSTIMIYQYHLQILRFELENWIWILIILQACIYHFSINQFGVMQYEQQTMVWYVWLFNIHILLTQIISNVHVYNFQIEWLMRK